jgi:hypothetical protein
MLEEKKSELNYNFSHEWLERLAVRHGRRQAGTRLCFITELASITFFTLTRFNFSSPSPLCYSLSLLFFFIHSHSFTSLHQHQQQQQHEQQQRHSLSEQ